MRNYQSSDFNGQAFGIGMDFDWNQYLYWSGPMGPAMDLVMPFGARVHLACVTNCSTVGMDDLPDPLVPRPLPFEIPL
jgi:hypothetical protein